MTELPKSARERSLSDGIAMFQLGARSPMQELRDLTRKRKQLVREISHHVLHIKNVLEDANLKLGSVLSDVMGKSGCAILQAIVDGERDAEKLANLAQGIARNKRAELVEAMHGHIRPRHRRLLKMHLELATALQRTVDELDTTIGRTLASIQITPEMQNCETLGRDAN